VTDDVPRVAILFKDGRIARLRSDELFPREAFYGATELAGCGLPVDIIEEMDLAGGIGSAWLERAASAMIHGLFGLNANSTARFMSGPTLERLNRYEVVVATTNAQGLGLAAARALGRLQPRILLLSTGVLPVDAPARHIAVFRRLVKDLSLAPMSRGEEQGLRSQLGPLQDLDYIPFGVDETFWTPAAAVAGGEDYVLSIGNDPQRDYGTLAAAWQPDFPWLKIVTRQGVSASDGDIEIISGDGPHHSLTDTDIRNLYRGARFVVLPLRQTTQPSGQSACLQAMACGKAVILSDTAGLWDRSVIRDGETCFLVRSESPGDLRRLVEQLLADPDRAAAIGARARDAVERYFGLAPMTTALHTRLSVLLAGAREHSSE
jgi:hypothetical protein